MGEPKALLKLAVRLLQDHHIKDGYNKKWCPVCTDVVTGHSNLARLEAALRLNVPAAAVCDVAGMDCVHDMPERCAIHWIAEPDSQQGWADYTHRQGKFEAAGGKNA